MMSTYLTKTFTKNSFKFFATLSLAALNIPLSHAQEQGAVFLHPGILYTQADLDRMKNALTNKQNPWNTDWQLLQANYLASSSYSFNPVETVYRNDTVNGSSGYGSLENSSSAAFLLAVEWSLTGNTDYSKAAISILNKWSSVLKSIKGKDAQLAASLNGYKLINAAELLRYSNSGWSSSDVNNFSKMMTDVFYPLTSTYGQVNGGWANGNWDAADIVYNMSLGIWKNDTALYNNAVEYFKNGEGNGSVIHYIQNDSGQLQESGRDQAHAQGGLGLLLIAAQMGYNQRQFNKSGTDMLSYPNDSYPLLNAVEYIAKYNLGYPVPYTPIAGKGYTLADMSKNNSWTPGLTISSRFRGQFRPIYRGAISLFTAAGVSDTKLPYAKEVISRMPIGKFYFDSPSYEGLLSATSPSTSNDMYVVIENSGASTNSYDSGEMISATGDSAPVTANETTPSNKTAFKMVYISKNHFAFRSLYTGEYLSVTADGSILPFSNEITDRETFSYTDSGNGNGSLLSLANHHYVYMDPNTHSISASATSVANDNSRWLILYPNPKDLGVTD